MRKPFFIAALLVFLFSCNRKPFVEHKITLEKKADNCNSTAASFRLNSNFGGERYEFEKCLPPDFDKSKVISERHVDAVVIGFPLPDGKV